MTWMQLLQEVVIKLLFPLIVAVLGTQLWNMLLERQRKKEEAYHRLYGPLRLYLSYIDSIDLHIDKIIKIPNIQTREKMEELGKDDSQTLSEFSLKNEMVQEWWRYVDAIKELLETNSGLIKDTHEPLVRDFIKWYIARQYSGKIHYGKNIPNHLRGYFRKADKRLILSIRKLKNTIL